MTLDELIKNYPHVYHMAETGTWESIRRHGLLSTIALLDLFEITGEQRESIALQHRPQKVRINHKTYGSATIRDQKPMSEGALRKCLQDGLTPTRWYEILNRRVFFWVSEERLNRLLGARAYRDDDHCVLTVNTAKLLKNHASRVTLCHINSGSTVYTPQPRGLNTFRSIDEYPFNDWMRKRSGKDAVVEFVVDYAVPDVADFVLRVEERKGPTITKTIFEKG